MREIGGGALPVFKGGRGEELVGAVLRVAGGDAGAGLVGDVVFGEVLGGRVADREDPLHRERLL